MATRVYRRRLELMMSRVSLGRSGKNEEKKWKEKKIISIHRLH